MGVVVDSIRDSDTGVTSVSLAGRLTVAGAAGVRAALLAYADEYPAAVLVNLAALQADPDAVSVFATVSRRAVRERGVPLLLYGAAPELGRKLTPHRAFIEVYRDQLDAARALHARPAHWLRRDLRPEPGSAATARRVVDDACLAWDLPRLRRPARLIVTELADNAIRHARTDFTLTVTHTVARPPVGPRADAATRATAQLRIVVEDHSPFPPRLLDGPPPGSPVPLAYQGHGLHVVERTAARWGTAQRPDGKIVWAVLDAALPDDRPTRRVARGEPRTAAAAPAARPSWRPAVLGDPADAATVAVPRVHPARRR